MKSIVILVALAIASSVLPAADLQGTVEGEQLFRIYCSSCHGITARGDGPAAAELKSLPRDLTLYSLNGGGEFPRQELMRRIAGIEQTPGHRSGAMPLWGIAFRQTGSDADQQEEVMARIRKLVDYLETIQKRK